MEKERLDLTHYLWLVSLRSELGQSPKAIDGAKRVLDAGTGTGIWAIEHADQHPQSAVIGVDLSPTQPTMVPPNCSFELNDLEEDWTWSQPFDLIISRYMTGCLADVVPLPMEEGAAVGKSEIDSIPPSKSPEGPPRELDVQERPGELDANPNANQPPSELPA